MDLKRDQSDGSDNKLIPGSPGFGNNNLGLGGAYSKNHANIISDPTPKVKEGLVNT
jgi:hypothetical protein